jgi:hypothetical protein
MKPSLRIIAVLAVAALVFAGLVGCSNKEETPASPSMDRQGITLAPASPQAQAVMAVQNLHTPRLMQDPEVVGTGTGLSVDGRPAVVVLLKSEAGASRVPRTLDGVPVVTVVTGEIRAFKPVKPTPHTARQPRPIELGVSGGNANDLANGYCCSGPLGALVQKGGTQYILSNSHVFCGDVAASATDPDVSAIGDPINQPGLIDVQCQKLPDDFVANLSSLSSYYPVNNNVDCAIAQVIPGMVRTDGSIYEIGVLSSAILEAYVGLNVKKSGRTTGLSRSYVNAINVTVNVGYEDECNGVAFTRTYTGQIMIYQKRSAFLAGGDSGSLLVEDVAAYPRAVGLLFAGSTSSAIANPIGAVLSYHGATMVGI